MRMAAQPHVYGPLGTLGVRLLCALSCVCVCVCGVCLVCGVCVCVSHCGLMRGCVNQQTMAAIYRQEGVWGFLHGLVPSIISQCSLGLLTVESEANTGHVAL
jgi:hypothetical protein